MIQRRYRYGYRDPRYRKVITSLPAAPLCRAACTKSVLQADCQRTFENRLISATRQVGLAPVGMQRYPMGFQYLVDHNKRLGGEEISDRPVLTRHTESRTLISRQWPSLRRTWLSCDTGTKGYINYFGEMLGLVEFMKGQRDG